jgi:uroporphyrinogen decarboxylase
VQAQAAAVLDDFGAPVRADGRRGGHVFNLGHGITPEIDPENVRVLVEAVRELSPAYHR